MACEARRLSLSARVYTKPPCAFSMPYSVGNPLRESIGQDSKHEEQSSQESQNGVNVTEVFPDGGARAWTVVIGVRVVLSLQSTDMAQDEETLGSVFQLRDVGHM